MDIILALYAEHEFNASTFAARVTASTLSDPYSAVTSALGTLKGPLHGGANEQAMQVLRDVGSPENAAAWVAEGRLRAIRPAQLAYHSEFHCVTRQGAEPGEALGAFLGALEQAQAQLGRGGLDS